MKAIYDTSTRQILTLYPMTQAVTPDMFAGNGYAVLNNFGEVVTVEIDADIGITEDFMPSDLQTVKAVALNTLYYHKEALNEKPFTYNGATFSVSRDARDVLTGAALFATQAVIAQTPFSITWYDDTYTAHVFDANGMMGFGQTFAVYLQTVFGQYVTRRQSVISAATVADVYGIMEGLTW